MMATFENQMKAFANLTEDKANKVFRKTCLDLSSGIIQSTPVDTGRARNNWFPNINTFSSGTTDEEDKSGAKAISKVAGVATSIKIGQTFTLTNNLDYIDRLEYGWSNKAPQGMVRLNLLRFDSILQSANRSIT
jgi:hypothetical protein